MQSASTRPTSGGDSRAFSVIIIGADTLLAALPVTAVQVAHACQQAGYDLVVPATWGDELIAKAVVQVLDARDDVPAIVCSCPLVARRLLAGGSDLEPFLIATVAPPVAAARYLRAMLAGRSLLLTYVGGCPMDADDALDARLSPQELFAMFAQKQIRPAELPLTFDSVIPPDRRRFHSQPGGLPAPDDLWSATHRREIVQVDEEDLSVDLGQLLLARRDVVIDLAPRLGCLCSGATDPLVRDPARARERVTTVEPPRASAPVIDESVSVELSQPIPAAARVLPDVAARVPLTAFADRRPTEVEPQPPVRESLATPPLREVADVPQRRRSPGSGLRAVLATTPLSRDIDGRQLPRAYVARRRVSPRSVRAYTPEASRDSTPAAQPVVPPTPAHPPEVPTARAEPASPAQPPRSIPTAAWVALLVLLSTAVGMLLGHWLRR